LEARPERFGLGLRRRIEEAAVASRRRAHAADRPAIDARRRHADEQAPVEARVAREKHLVGSVAIDRHGAIIAAGSLVASRFWTRRPRGGSTPAAGRARVGE